MSVATKVKDKIFIEVIDCQNTRNGNLWIINFLSKADIAKIAIDGAGSQDVLKTEIKDYGIKTKVVLPTVKEVIVANNLFEQGVISLKNILHNNQPSLTQVVTNCEHRAIGTNGGYGYKALVEEHEIALLDSAILAYWLCVSTKEKKKQRVSY